jgi:hypothetical protein
MTVAASAGLLSACSGSGSDVKQACDHIKRAERFIVLAKTTSGPTARHLGWQAEHQLALAEPLAAQAAGVDPSWDALQANLQQAHSIPTRMIMPALRADCQGNY